MKYFSSVLAMCADAQRALENDNVSEALSSLDSVIEDACHAVSLLSELAEE